MKKNAITLLIGLICFSGFSQKTVKEWSELEDKKFFKKIQFSSQVHHIKKLAKSPDEIPKLDKIGILGFSLIQPRYVTKTKTSIISGAVTEEGTKFFVDIMYGDALPSIKQKFQNLPISIIEPSEYLTDEAKTELFNETVFEVSKSFNWTMKMSMRLRASGKRLSDVKGCPEELKYVVVSNADPKVWRAVGKLAGEMDLDAVLVIENTMGFDGKVLTLQKITTSIIGPNTVPYDEGSKKYYAPMGPLKGYLEGILYGGTEITVPKGNIILATFKKEKVTSLHFDGIGEVYSRLVIETMKRTQEKIANLTK